MNNREQNALDLYGAFSEADSRFVDEMLDDGLAETIRARNKRKKIRITSAFSAAAAVLVIAVCLGVVPKAKLSTKDGAPSNSITYGENKRNNMAAGENTDGDTLNLAPEQKSEAPETQNTAPAEEQYQYEDEAEEDKIEPPAEEQTAHEETANEDSTATRDSNSATKTVKTPAGNKASDDFAAVDDFDDIGNNNNSNGNDGNKTEENDKSEENAADASDGAAAPETVSLSQNVRFALGESISSNHRGRFLAEGNGFTLYEFDNCDPEMIVTVERGNELRAALRCDILPETIGELYYGLDLERYLRCDGIEGSDESYEDDRFRAEVWNDLFADPDKSPRTENDPQTGGVTFICRLGNDDETFVKDIKITMYDDGTAGFKVLGMSGRYVLP